MNKSELIDAMAQESGLSKTDAGKALDAFTQVVKNTLQADGKVTLIGFGEFGVTERAERQGRNPKTKEPITIPAARVPRFKAGKLLKDALLPAEKPTKKAPAKKAAKK